MFAMLTAHDRFLWRGGPICGAVARSVARWPDLIVGLGTTTMNAVAAREA
jgi:hypothetical protein